MSNSPRLGIPYMLESQAQKEVIHNEMINKLELLVQASVISISNTPPTTPAEGDVYIIGTAPTGVWSGKAKNVAGYIGGTWIYLQALEGWNVWVQTPRLYYWYHGGAWIEGPAGKEGKSAYQSWLDTGNTGTEAIFLASLKGEKGDTGAIGPAGPKGEDGIIGVDGKSVYQIWLDAGNTGTINDFLSTLKGAKGDPGTNGVDGTPGIVWKGVWNSATGYAVHDAVTYQGSSYLALTAHTNIDPVANPSTWAILAVKGADGLGAGDMLKTTYDTNNNGKVDTAEVAESVEWANVENKPESFTPSTHKASHSSGGTDAISPSDIGAIPDIPLVVQGDIIYRGSEGWSRLAAGTSGQVLKTQGTAANPHWANESGGSGGSTTLAELTDVSIPSPTNDQVLSYNSASSKWEAKDPTGGSVTETTYVSTSGIANIISTTIHDSQEGDWGGYTMRLSIPNSSLLTLCKQWKAELLVFSGTLNITKMVVKRTGIESTAVIDTTTLTVSGSESFTISAGRTFTDPCNIEIDNEHDYHLYVYIAVGSTGVAKRGNRSAFTTPTSTKSDITSETIISNLGVAANQSLIGRILVVDPQIVQLNDLGNVSKVSPTNGQILAYDSTSSKWKPSSILDGLEAAIAAINGV